MRTPEPRTLSTHDCQLNKCVRFITSFTRVYYNLIHCEVGNTYAFSICVAGILLAFSINLLLPSQFNMIQIQSLKF